MASSTSLVVSLSSWSLAGAEELYVNLSISLVAAPTSANTDDLRDADEVNSDESNNKSQLSMEYLR